MIIRKSVRVMVYNNNNLLNLLYYIEAKAPYGNPYALLRAVKLVGLFVKTQAALGWGSRRNIRRVTSRSSQKPPRLLSYFDQAVREGRAA